MSKKLDTLKILNKLNSEDNIPMKQDLGLNNWEYGDLLDSMIDNNLISGNKSQRANLMEQEKNSSNDDRVLLGFGSYKIEVKGMDCLENNTEVLK